MEDQVKKENEKYTSNQILTYLGNKRLLLENIEKEIFEIKKEKITAIDLFSGSGIVARMMKKHCQKLIVNDMEKYSQIINECFLFNKTIFDNKYYNETLKKLNEEYEKEKVEGIITNNYAPADDDNIKENERVFFTRKNAVMIDTYRNNIEKFVKDDYKKFFLAPLLIEVSIHTNTSGVFKGFYKDKNTGVGIFGGTEKNSLKRILGNISIEKPELSNFDAVESVVLLEKK